MNLLEETLNILKENDLSANDVLWIGNTEFKTDWNNFQYISDIAYDNGFGCPEVAQDLLIVGSNWWLERQEYDGSEWWEFKKMPVSPSNKITLKKVTGGCYNNLEDLNKKSTY